MSSPWTSAPPNASPAPRPLTTSTGSGGTSALVPSAASARTPSGPCLTTTSRSPLSLPASRRARAAAYGSRSPWPPRTRRGCRRRRSRAAVPRRSTGGPPPGPPRTSAASPGRGPSPPPGPGPQRLQGRGATRLGAQAGAGRPEDPGGADRVEVQLVRVDLQVGGLGAAVEGEREVVGREEGAERDGGEVLLDLGHPAVVHPEALQLAAQIGPEGVGAGAGDECGAAAEPGGGDGHVRRGAAEELGEGVDPVEPDTGLERVQVHAEAPHGDQVVRLRLHPRHLSRPASAPGSRRAQVPPRPGPCALGPSAPRSSRPPGGVSTICPDIRTTGPDPSDIRATGPDPGGPERRP